MLTRLRTFRLYLLLTATFTLFWWPLSHWFYSEWYHRLLGFESYVYAFIKITGTISAVPVANMFFLAANPVRNRDMAISLLLFFPLMAITYIYLIDQHHFPALEYVNVALLLANPLLLSILLPGRKHN